MSLTLEEKAYLRKEMGKGGVYLYMDTIHQIENDIKKEGGGYTYIWIPSTIRKRI